ncbi:hypothetical protein RHDC2_00758 [Rhodocyclaceae bacterium]|nr:hypothetical protein RHDC2_00758 [Rhodocyclaceae bacterium]
MNSALVKDSGLPEGAAVFFDACARQILSQHTHEIPDLRRIMVLLPDYHVAQPLAQNLARAASLPALLLPQMLTLNDWAQSVPLAQSVTPNTCRATTLYQALRERRWFADADLWGIVRELLTLLDDLTHHHVTLPQSEEDFLAQLEQAYQARRGSAMQFEARVVHELWYAMQSSGELDAARAYQQRLAQLAQQASAPLYVFVASDLAVPEACFLEAYAEHAPVTCFDLREMMAREASCAVLLTLSPTLSRKREREPTYSPLPLAGEGQRESGGVSLRDQSIHLREHFPHSALNNPSTGSGRTERKLRLFAAHGLEHEARAADVQVRRWLLAEKKNIAIVAQDRLVARRVRALLERSGVLVRDETGWTFSTLAVSTVLMRWLDALQSDFYHHDLLDLLKSPFIFADQDYGERKHAVYQLEQLVRKHGVAAHLDAFLELAHDEPEVQIPLVRLRQAAEPLRRKNQTLAGWLGALDDSLTILGVNQGLEADAAGMQLLQALQTWRTELEGDSTRFSLAEWRHWLAQQLDEHTFRDMGIDSTVLLTHLAATRWRSFDAVLLLGCDAAHLPSSDNSGLWFNDAVRATLGLSVSGTRMAQQRDDLLALLAMNNTVLATWQASKNGEPNLLSPYLEMLRALHEQAYGDDLAERELGELLEEAQMRSGDFPLPDAAAMPAPAVPQSLIPGRISASGYNSLVACPYQFYARHMLRLNELDEVREGVEKRDYGEWVHAILHRFHQQFPVLGEHDRTLLEEALLNISSEEFAPAVERDYLARAWLLRWQQAIPAYLDAQLKSEAEGWHYQSGEVPFELPLADDLLMHGRIDRVDERKGECRVLDYKMMDATRLRHKLKEAGEDVQLACYASVYEAEEAAFISIEKDKVINVAPPQDLPQLAQANIVRLLEMFGQMRAGATMPAYGVEEACAYCEMRGLCRKAEWSSA